MFYEDHIKTKKNLQIFNPSITYTGNHLKRLFMDTIKNFYNSLIKFGSSLQSFLLLAVRLFWGILFFQAGSGKLAKMPATIESLANIGIPLPELSAHLLAWTETIGGACLIVGFASRLVALPLIFGMLVALFTAHFDGIKNVLSNPGSILKLSPFTYLLASLIVLIFGPGRFSIDYVLEMLGRSKHK